MSFTGFLAVVAALSCVVLPQSSVVANPFELTPFSPAEMWIGLPLDFSAGPFLDATKIGDGLFDNVPSGSSGNNASASEPHRAAMEVLKGRAFPPRHAKHRSGRHDSSSPVVGEM